MLMIALRSYEMNSYKPALNTIISTTIDEQGHESHPRLANSTRYAGRPVQSVLHSTPRSQLPVGPEEELVKARKPGTEAVEARLKALLKIRPVWTKQAIGNHLTVGEWRIVQK
jgi:hypothetical protein